MAEDKALPLCGDNSKKQVKWVVSQVLPQIGYVFIKTF
jgi:hypothetical protein